MKKVIISLNLTSEAKAWLTTELAKQKHSLINPIE
jgi:hypothetical protein